jgi:hypothetical protein
LLIKNNCKLNIQQTCPHLLILFLSIVSPEVLLDDDGCRPHLEEPPPAVPASNAPLQDEDLSGQNSISFLLEEKVLRVLQEDFRPAELVVGLTEHDLTDLRGPASALVLNINGYSFTM